VVDYAKYAHLSDIVYGRDCYYMRASGYHEMQEINKKSEYIAICISDDEICIVFRGSDDNNDWMENFKIFPVLRNKYGTVHQGIYEAYKQIAGDLRKIIKDHYMLGKRFVFTGHSKGGAMALFASYDLSVDFPFTEIHCVTFGAPKSGKADWEKKFKESKIHCVQFVNGKDPVPRFPRGWAGWKHIGKVFNLEDGWFSWLWFGDPRDHRIYKYEANIKKLDLKNI
jgi:triacylglycerol lipase